MACGDNTSFRGGKFIYQNYYRELYSVAYFHYFCRKYQETHILRPADYENLFLILT